MHGKVARDKTLSTLSSQLKSWETLHLWGNYAKEGVWGHRPRQYQDLKRRKREIWATEARLQPHPVLSLLSSPMTDFTCTEFQKVNYFVFCFFLTKGKIPLKNVILHSLHPNLSWFSGTILGNTASLEFGFKNLIQGIKKISIAPGGIPCLFVDIYLCYYLYLLYPPPTCTNIPSNI